MSINEEKEEILFVFLLIILIYIKNTHLTIK